MKIYEKIFARLDELNISQTELSRRTGIATSTISDWRKKQINPQADKLCSICKALDMSLVELLCDEEGTEHTVSMDYVTDEKHMIELFRQSDTESRRFLKSVNKSMTAISHGSVMFRSFRILMEIILW